MPEIWLNYGSGDVVLDIRAENLSLCKPPDGPTLDGPAASGRLADLDTSKPVSLVPLHDTPAVRTAIGALFAECERRSHPAPRVLAEDGAAGGIAESLPEGAAVLPFGDTLEDSSLVFAAEMEFDGLFGYESVSTRLLRRFGGDAMLDAFMARGGDAPAPGRDTDCARIASEFSDRFDIHCVEVVAGAGGIIDLRAGHPKDTAALRGKLHSHALQDFAPHKSVLVSAGKAASSGTLARSLASLWNCRGGVKGGGTVVLAAECGAGFGSEAIRRYAEGRLASHSLKNPARYLDGMEHLLYISEVLKSMDVILVSALPEFYVRRLGLASAASAGRGLRRVLQEYGARRKVLVVPDGARTILQRR